MLYEVITGLQTLSPNLVYEHIDAILFDEFSGEVSIPGAKGPVIDDEPAVAEMLADLAQAERHEVAVAHSAASALELMETRNNFV